MSDNLRINQQPLPTDSATTVQRANPAEGIAPAEAATGTATVPQGDLRATQSEVINRNNEIGIQQSVRRDMLDTALTERTASAAGAAVLPTSAVQPPSAPGVSFNSPIGIERMPPAAREVLQPAIEGNPPRLDLNRITPQQIEQMPTETRQHFFDWLGRGQDNSVLDGRQSHALTLAQNTGRTGQPLLANALAARLMNQSADPARTMSALLELREPPTGLQNLMRSATPEVMRDAATQMVGRLSADGLTSAEFQQINRLFSTNPSFVSAESIARLTDGALQSGGLLDSSEATALSSRIQDYFRTVNVDNADDVRNAVTNLREEMNRLMPNLSAQQAGYVAGLVGDGMVRHIGSIADDRTQRAAWASAFAGGTVGAVGARLGGTADIVLSALGPLVQQAIQSGANAPNSQAVMDQIRDLALRWEQRPQDFGWSPEQGRDASRALQTMLLGARRVN